MGKHRTFVFEEVAHAGAPRENELRDILDDLCLVLGRQGGEPLGQALGRGKKTVSGSPLIENRNCLLFFKYLWDSAVGDEGRTHNFTLPRQQDQVAAKYRPSAGTVRDAPMQFSVSNSPNCHPVIKPKRRGAGTM